LPDKSRDEKPTAAKHKGSVPAMPLLLKSRFSKIGKQQSSFGSDPCRLLEAVDVIV
jgi:hypothetical protein